MIQDFINKQFFSLFVFTLIFGLLLYGTIGFDFIDEICATLLFILFGYSLFKSQEWLINKAFLTTIGVFLFYLCYSLCINSNTKAAIITDFIIQFKPYLALFCVYSLRPHFSTNQKKILRIICVFFWLILLILACIEIFKPHTLSNVMAHATYFAAGVIATSLCFLYTGDFSMKDRILFIIMLSIVLISGRSKFYGFFTLSVMVIIYFSNINHFKLNINYYSSHYYFNTYISRLMEESFFLLYRRNYRRSRNRYNCTFCTLYNLYPNINRLLPFRMRIRKFCYLCLRIVLLPHI